MSHDRGCHCGREKYEYDDCPKTDCLNRRKYAKVTRLGRRAGRCTAKNKKENTRNEDCQFRASYKVNDKNLCTKHAGMHLLREMMK